MEKPSKIHFKGKSSLEPTIDVNEKNLYTKDTVSIMCLVDATVKITGTVTKTVYTFSGAGSIVDVDVRDKDEILNKKRGRSCCGGTSNKNLFELI